MKPKQFLLIILLLCGFVQTPERTITGIVTDDNQMPLQGVTISVKDSRLTASTDQQGRYRITVPVSAKKLVFSYIGFLGKEVSITSKNELNISLSPDYKGLNEIVYLHSGTSKKALATRSAPGAFYNQNNTFYRGNENTNTESYKNIKENTFQLTQDQSVTTFSIDVDRASYSNIRRFLNMGQMPPVDAVRIEEMINYFDYDYAQPKNEHPISVTTELSDSPWNKQLKLLHIGLQAKTIPTDNLPPSNLVFLIDVSGSMMTHNKLPLLKNAFKLLVDQLRAQDKVSIVVYAGAAGLVLEPTPGNEKTKIREALENLSAGGSTAGGAGIELAYKIARENFLPKGNNRIILATDGDFNVGISSEGDLERMIEAKRKYGIYLSIAGFGMGNYKDSHIETLADKGNGNYSYIDNMQEARKVFVNEFGGTLFTVAKDVKLQIEFNPTKVKAFRLIGYENRALKNEEFHDDKKDAGELGSGHCVTALYEIVPADVNSSYLSKIDTLKYKKVLPSENAESNDLLTLKIRYKSPESDQSTLFQTVVPNVTRPLESTSDNFRFAISVAELGLILRRSEFRGSAGYESVIARAQGALGKDMEAYRSEFISLAKTARLIDRPEETAKK